MPGKNVLKIFDENGFYHLYNRGVEKRPIFLDGQDYAVFLSYLKNYLSVDSDEKPMVSPSRQLKNYADSIDLLCYCLMPNHFHFLIRQYRATAITDFVRSLLTKYAMYFNRKYSRVGCLFQGRYRAVMVESESQLVYLSRYIHRNPDPTRTDPVGVWEYRYSSLANYLGKIRQVWVKHNCILDLFSKTNTSTSSYLSFVSNSEGEVFLGSMLLDEAPTGSVLEDGESS